MTRCVAREILVCETHAKPPLRIVKQATVALLLARVLHAARRRDQLLIMYMDASWKRRTAVKQVIDPVQAEETCPAEPQTTGQRQKRTRSASKYRCYPEVHSGRTKGSDADQRTFCIHFARGCCSEGPQCLFLHHLPTEEDEAYHNRNLGYDIFNREKRAEHEGFHRGAGTFERDNRTLYVNYEGAGSYTLPQIRQLLQDNFNVWGPVKNIYIKHQLTIAFVTYDWRSSAEFAKEAMNRQKLIGSTQAEVLTVRWSNNDPNPTAVAKRKRDAADALEQAVLDSWEQLPEEVKAARVANLQLAASFKKGQVVSEYPDTDHQYNQSAADNTDDTAAGLPEAQTVLYPPHQQPAYGYGYGYGYSQPYISTGFGVSRKQSNNGPESDASKETPSDALPSNDDTVADMQQPDTTESVEHHAHMASYTGNAADWYAAAAAYQYHYWGYNAEGYTEGMGGWGYEHSPDQTTQGNGNAAVVSDSQQQQQQQQQALQQQGGGAEQASQGQDVNEGNVDGIALLQGYSSSDTGG